MTLALLLKNWKLALSGLALLAILGLWFAYSHAQQVARAQKVRLEAASRNAEIASVTTKAVDAVAAKSEAIQEHTHVVVQRIREAPGADTPVDPALLSVWRSGLSDGADDPPH